MRAHDVAIRVASFASRKLQLRPAASWELLHFTAQVWVELMRTRTLSLDDLAEPKIVSVAWVQADGRQQRQAFAFAGIALPGMQRMPTPYRA